MLDTISKYSHPDLTDEMIIGYYITLLEHINNVQSYGLMMGLPTEQMEAHDISKFTELEFVAYALYHNGGLRDENTVSFYKLAYNNHVHNNPHHWNYWLINWYSGKGTEDVEALEIPDIYADEMIADWHGANMTYKGGWDISEWFNENFTRMKIHDNTRNYIYQRMFTLGYDIDYDSSDNGSYRYIVGERVLTP